LNLDHTFDKSKMNERIATLRREKDGNRETEDIGKNRAMPGRTVTAGKRRWAPS